MVPSRHDDRHDDIYKVLIRKDFRKNEKLSADDKKALGARKVPDLRMTGLIVSIVRGKNPG